jgi:predicted glycosyltransferase involved in capsule biosynthesis
MNSNLDNVLLLNDDIKILNNDFFNQCDEILEEDVKMVLFNDSFSHFFVNKIFLNEIGYFDERLLGFGWEDTDMWMRFKELTGDKIKTVNTTSIYNESSDLIYDDVKTTWGKYSTYNYEYIKTKYSNPAAERYTCGKKLKEDVNPYPTESYFLSDKNLIFNNENN